MPWVEIEAAWHELVDQIVAAWPELAPERLMAIAGDREQFTAYVAMRYDLTPAEAAEVMEFWLWRKTRSAARAPTRAA